MTQAGVPVAAATNSAADEASAQVPPLQSWPSAGAPSVVLALLDDASYGTSSTFGRPADTPPLDALAHDGLRCNRFHTTGKSK